jgi:hypothetical protein
MAKKVASTKGAGKKSSGSPMTFDSAVLVKKLLSEVPERAREVLVYRFGLGSTSARETLEAIGERWGITRERVRQIEASGIDAIRNSRTFKDVASAFDELATHIEAQGAIVPEDVLLQGLASDEKSRNRYRFLLVVGSAFFRERETDEFYARWHVDHRTADQVHAALTKLYSQLDDAEVLSEGDIVNKFLDELKDVNAAYRNEEILKRWLSISKTICKNHFALGGYN